MWACWPEIKKTWKWYIKLIIWILNKCLDILCPHFFQASCKKHDKWYEKGWDEEQRSKCDDRFFHFICRDIEKLKTNIFKKLYLYAVAIMFYTAVRLGWGIAFNYHKNGNKKSKSI